jgi:hypothetical protein
MKVEPETAEYSNVGLERSESIIAEVAISCGYCLRSSAVDPALSSKVDQRAARVSSFVNCVPSLRAHSDAVVVFNRVLRPCVKFLREGCPELIRQSLAQLDLVGPAATTENLMLNVKSTPEDPQRLLDDSRRLGYYSEVLLRAHFIRQGTEDFASFRKIFDYFATCIPVRDLYSLDLFTGAIRNILSEVDRLHLPTSAFRERGRRPLDRWVERRGW